MGARTIQPLNLEQTVQTYFNSGFGSSTDSVYDVISGSYSVMVIPEPSVGALGALSLIGLLRRRR